MLLGQGGEQSRKVRYKGRKLHLTVNVKARHGLMLYCPLVYENESNKYSFLRYWKWTPLSVLSYWFEFDCSLCSHWEIVFFRSKPRCICIIRRKQHSHHLSKHRYTPKVLVWKQRKLKIDYDAGFIFIFPRKISIKLSIKVTKKQK